MSTPDIQTIGKSSGRKDYLDVARGICMIAIVLGHLGNPYIDRVVFTFHLPVFFLITGFFFRPDEPFKNLITKRFKGLIVPYYFSCGCILLFSYIINLILKTGKTEVNEYLMRICISTLWGAGDNWDLPFEIPGIGAIWFLWATFWGCILLHVLLKISPLKRALIILGMLYFARWTVNNLGFAPLSIQPGCTSVLFIYIGYLWKENEIKLRNLSTFAKALFGIIALILWGEFIHYFCSFWLVHSDFGHGALDVVASVFASFLVIAFSRGLDKRIGRFLLPLKMIGKYSIIALCAHIIELKTFPWWKIVPDILGEEASYLAGLYLKIALKICWIFTFTFVVSKLNVFRRIFNLKPIVKQTD